MKMSVTNTPAPKYLYKDRLRTAPAFPPDRDPPGCILMTRAPVCAAD